MDEEIKKKLSSADTWLRGFFMLLFVVVLGATKAIVVGLVIFQFLTRLITGTVNERLVSFCEKLAQYISQTVLYLCYVTEDKPFPFNDWPTSSIIDSSVDKTKQKPAKNKTSGSGTESGTGSGTGSGNNADGTVTASSPIPSSTKPNEPANYQ